MAPSTPPTLRNPHRTAEEGPGRPWEGALSPTLPKTRSVPWPTDLCRTTSVCRHAGLVLQAAGAQRGGRPGTRLARALGRRRLARCGLRHPHGAVRALGRVRAAHAAPQPQPSVPLGPSQRGARGGASGPIRGGGHPHRVAAGRRARARPRRRAGHRRRPRLRGAVAGARRRVAAGAPARGCRGGRDGSRLEPRREPAGGGHLLGGRVGVHGRRGAPVGPARRNRGRRQWRGAGAGVGARWAHLAGGVGRGGRGRPSGPTPPHRRSALGAKRRARGGARSPRADGHHQPAPRRDGPCRAALALQWWRGGGLRR